MGWDGHYAENWKNGKPDVMAEFYDRWSFGGNSKNHEILKAVKVGTTIYSAIKDKRDDVVFGCVSLTSIDNGYVMFKEMTEFDGPGYFDCPKSILKLLSPTDSEWANDWRKHCKEQAGLKNTSPTYIKNSKVGDLLIYRDRDILIHCPPMAQFRTDFWKMLGENRYVKKTEVNPQTAVAFSRENLENSFINVMNESGSKELFSGMPNIVKNGEKQLPAIFNALFNSEDIELNERSLLKFGINKGELWLVYDGKEVSFRREVDSPLPEDINHKDRTFYKKDALSDICQEAVRTLEEKLAAYTRQYGADDIIRSEKAFADVINDVNAQKEVV